MLWTALAGMIFGLIGFGEIAEDWLRVARNSLHEHKASGQIVVVKIDDQALRALRQLALVPTGSMLSLSTGSRPQAPRGIFFDVSFTYRTDNNVRCGIRGLR